MVPAQGLTRGLRAIDGPCECEQNNQDFADARHNPDFADARLLPFVVLAVAPAK